MFDRNKTAPQNSATERPGNNETQEVRKPVISTTSAPRSTAYIGSTVRINGDLHSEENLIVDGTVEGNINLESHELTVGQSGHVNANVCARVVKIDGQVQGDLVGKEKVIISKSGNVRGNITAPAVSLEDGAKFKGSIDMSPTVVKPAEAPLPDLSSVSKATRVTSEPVKSEPSVTSKHG